MGKRTRIPPCRRKAPRPSWLSSSYTHLRHRNEPNSNRQATMAEKTDNELPALSQSSYYPPRQRKIHDSNVTFEEYSFYAQRTREEQRLHESPPWQWRTVFSPRKKTAEASEEEHNHNGPSDSRIVTDEEWLNASRAFRTASWGAIFYLVSERSEAYSKPISFKAKRLDHHRYSRSVRRSIRYWHTRLWARCWYIHSFRHCQLLQWIPHLEDLHGGRLP